jgi:hypothetical protein
MSIKSISLFLAPLAVLFLTGCEVTLNNLSPQRVPQNPSSLYTLSFSPEVRNAAIDRDSMRGEIVIDGQRFPMQRIDLGEPVFSFDYFMPAERNTANYFFVLNYDINRRGVARPHSVTSEVFSIALSNRYVISLEANRGPVGSVVPVLGRGFTRNDQIIIGGIEAETRFVSSNKLSFVVPPLPAGQSYAVEIVTQTGRLDVADYRVDAAIMNVLPRRIQVASGSTTTLVFSIDTPAPAGGISIEILTNVPRSVIMPDVTIPAGQRSVSVTIEGGVQGSGNLFTRADGFNEIQIPITVTAF